MKQVSKKLYKTSPLSGRPRVYYCGTDTFPKPSITFETFLLFLASPGISATSWNVISLVTFKVSPVVWMPKERCQRRRLTPLQLDSREAARQRCGFGCARNAFGDFSLAYLWHQVESPPSFFPTKLRSKSWSRLRSVLKYPCCYVVLVIMSWTFSSSLYVTTWPAMCWTLGSRCPYQHEVKIVHRVDTRITR